MLRDRILWCLLRLFISIAAVLALSFVGMFFLAVAAMGGTRFTSNMIVTVFAGLAVYLVLLIFNVLNRRWRGGLLVTFFAVCALVISLHDKYPASVPTEVDMTQYEPFAKETKAVHLGKQASLRITNDPPTLDGATALYPLYAAFVQATYPPAVSYDVNGSTVRCGTTPEAYSRLIEGEVDIVFAARPSHDQRQEARNRGVTLKLTPIGREAFVFFVNSRNPITGLTTEQIQGTYTGRIKNWKDVGGTDQAIRAFQRPEGSGSQTMLQKIMEGKNLMKPPLADTPRMMGEIIEQAADYRNFKNAIGFSFLFYTTQMVGNNQIRLLQINGVMPTRESVRNKTYPYTADFYAVTAGSKNPNVKPFIRWILSPEGQTLVEKTGYTPIKVPATEIGITHGRVSEKASR